MPEIEVGKVSDYFARPMVAGVDLIRDLKSGSHVHILGHTTDLEMEVASMQIDHRTSPKLKPGDSVGIKVPERVRPGDTVYTRYALVFRSGSGILLTRFAISMAATAASNPLLPILVPARSMACSRFSAVMTPLITGKPAIQRHAGDALGQLGRYIFKMWRAALDDRPEAYDRVIVAGLGQLLGDQRVSRKSQASRPRKRLRLRPHAGQKRPWRRQAASG